MTRSGPNPVLAPIRRWVLYSRTNLAISVVASIAVLSLAGLIFGEDPQPRPVDGTAAPRLDSAQPAAAIEYTLDEVSESVVVAKSASWVASHAPATAMAYAHVFVDTTLSDAEWTRALSHYTVEAPRPATVAARPRTPIVITGPTTSTSVIDEKTTQVSVPTQAGDLLITVVTEHTPDGGARWAVAAPLPTLDLPEDDTLTPPTTTGSTPRTSTDDDPTTAPTPTTRISPTSAPAPTTTPRPSPVLDDAEATPPRTVDPAPVPVPGPIPIPDLDTPIPGQL